MSPTYHFMILVTVVARGFSRIYSNNTEHLTTVLISDISPNHRLFSALAGLY